MHAKTPIHPRQLADPRFLLATAFGTGLSPLAPGTLASLLALFLFLPLAPLPLWAQLAAILLLSLAGIYLAGEVSRLQQAEDHPAIVIDEVAGMWLALLALPAAPLVWALAFILFRLLDITKPWPLGWMDKNLKSGFGIMLDDLAAGAFTCLALHAALQLFPDFAAFLLP